MKIQITIPIVPKAQARDRITARGGFARSYKDKKQRLAEDTLLTLLMSHKPLVPFTGEVSLRIKVYVATPKSKPRKWRETALRAIYPIRPITKPDVDNYAKQILDVMSGTFFEDDRQVVDLSISKFYGEIPRWEIILTGEYENA